MKPAASHVSDPIRLMCLVKYWREETNIIDDACPPGFYPSSRCISPDLPFPCEANAGASENPSPVKGKWTSRRLSAPCSLVWPLLVLERCQWNRVSVAPPFPSRHPLTLGHPLCLLSPSLSLASSLARGVGTHKLMSLRKTCFPHSTWLRSSFRV